ncbi:MAG: hypothetical protein KF830_06885 [Planctomycetes bacterium]|nr:hypothetical protein [Planctomycetota bacterium]
MSPSFLSAFAATAILAGSALAQAQPAEAKPDDSGFLTGLRGFEHFHEPLGQPLYFESPFNDTGLRFLYLRHDFSNQSTLQGGNVTVYALQARLALTERLAFIATKDGYSELESGIAQSDGWNDIAAGFKYVLLADRENDFVLTPGIRYQARNGDTSVLQGRADEFSPFVSVAKGYGRTHLLGNATLRVPVDGDKGNTVGHWDLHVDYDVNPGAEAVFAPLLEIHGVHYLSDGNATLDVGGLDYTNLGSMPAKSFVCWAGVGARLEIVKRFELGFAYEFALTDPDDDIMDRRITIDFITRW